MLVTFEPPPGLFRNGTELQSAGRWRDASLVRWHEGTIRPIGGWQAFDDETTAGTVRAMHAWRSSNSRGYFLALGSGGALEVFTREGDLIDVSPSDLVGGREVGRQAVGYGVGPYGRGAYGSDYTATTLVKPAALWSLDNWGDYLVACHDLDGRIFVWEGDANAKATPIAEAPVDNVGLVVSDQRFLFALGAGGNPRNVAWCDREDYTVWESTATNEAGDYTLATAGNIMAATPVNGDLLIHTDVDVHVCTYVGPQIVHEFEHVGSGCGIISRNAAVTVNGSVMWMGQNGFYAYQGGQVTDMPCEVSDYVFSDMGRYKDSHVYATQVSEFNEVWWFYTSSEATDNDRYVVFNYATGAWYTGNLSRTAALDRGVHSYPLMVDGNTVYEHERGAIPDGNPVFIETGPHSIGNGEQTFTASRFYPDELSQGDVTATFKTRRYPNGPESTHGPYVLGAPTGVRFTGRQVRMRLDKAGDDFRVGVQRLEVATRGRR